MNKKAILTSIALLAIAMGGAALGQAKKPTPPATPLSDEDFLVFFENHPAEFFNRAHSDFLNGYWWSCAAELRKAAAELKLDARRSTWTESSNELIDAGYTLDILANDIERGRTLPITRMEHVFVQAHRALADHDLILTREAWKRSEPVRTGRNLVATVNNIENGMSWAGYELGDDNMTTVSQGIAVGDELVNGSTVDASVVEKCLTNVGNLVGRLDDIVLTEKWLPLTSYPASASAPIVYEEVWYTFKDVPDDLFHQAHAAVLERNYGDAANDIRRATAFVRMKWELATGKARDALKDSVDQLQVLTKELDDGTPPMMQAMRQTFARTLQSLAKYYRESVMDAQARSRTVEAGEALKATVTQLNRAAAWSGHEMESADRGVTMSADYLADKMIQGYDWSADELDKTLAALGKQIDQVDGWLRTKPIPKSMPRSPSPSK